MKIKGKEVNMGKLSNDEILLKIYEEQQLIKTQLEDVPSMKSNMVIRMLILRFRSSS